MRILALVTVLVFVTVLPGGEASESPCAPSQAAAGVGAGTGREDVTLAQPAIVVLPATVFVPGTPARPAIVVPALLIPPVSTPGTPAVTHPGTPALATPAVRTPAVLIHVGDFGAGTPQLFVPAQSIAPAQPPQTLVPGGNPTQVTPGMTTQPVGILPAAPGSPGQWVTVGEGTPIETSPVAIVVLDSPTACAATPAGEARVGIRAALALVP